MVPGLNTIGFPEPKSVRAYEVMFVTAQIIEVSILLEFLRKYERAAKMFEEKRGVLLANPKAGHKEGK